MSVVNVAVPPASLNMNRSWLLIVAGLIVGVAINAPMAVARSAAAPSAAARPAPASPGISSRAAARSAGYFITPARGSLTSGLGWRADPFRRAIWQHHWGIDIAAPEGTPVQASAPGVVQFAGWYAGYGRLVYIDHGDGWTTLYGHVKRMGVQPGDVIGQGEVIATVGTSGRSTGPHVHFEIRYKDWPVDPLKYIGR